MARLQCISPYIKNPYKTTNDTTAQEPQSGRRPGAAGMPHGRNGGRAANQLAHSHLQKRAKTPCQTARMALPNGPHEAAKRPIRPCRTARATWRHANCKGTKKACPMKGQAQTIIKKQLQSASNLRNDAQLGAFDKRGNHADGLAIGHLLLYLQYGIKHRRLPVEHKSVGICNVLLCLCV